MSSGSTQEKDLARLGGRGLLVLLFVVYLVLLTWMVLWRFDVPYVGASELRRIKLVRFIPGNGSGASAPLEVLANLLIFVPFGLHLGLLAPSWPWWKAAGAVAGASLALEVSQYVLAVGSSDITDLVVNVAGGLAGGALAVQARRRLRGRTAVVMTRVCSVGTVLALLAVAVFVASPLRYGPPRRAAAVAVTPIEVDPSPVGYLCAHHCVRWDSRAGTSDATSRARYPTGPTRSARRSPASA